MYINRNTIAPITNESFPELTVCPCPRHKKTQRNFFSFLLYYLHDRPEQSNCILMCNVCSTGSVHTLSHRLDNLFHANKMRHKRTTREGSRKSVFFISNVCLKLSSSHVTFFCCYIVSSKAYCQLAGSRSRHVFYSTCGSGTF